MVEVREYECGCKITTDKNYPSIEYCPLHKSAPELYEVCKLWLTAHSDEAMRLVALTTEQALAKAGGK